MDWAVEHQVGSRADPKVGARAGYPVGARADTKVGARAGHLVGARAGYPVGSRAVHLSLQVLFPVLPFIRAASLKCVCAYPHVGLNG